MSKRCAEVATPRRRKHGSDVLYLCVRAAEGRNSRADVELDTETSPFIVEADDSDATKWMVGLSSGALREHLGLPALANDLNQWARATRNRKPPIMSWTSAFPRTTR